MAEGPGEFEMVATYEVEIVGVKRTQRQLEELDGEIASLRAANYSGKSSGGVTGSKGSSDLFETTFMDAVGRVQGKAQQAMLRAMDAGKQYQIFALATAITPTGLDGKGHNGEGRRGPGRDDTGKLIDSLARGVETLHGPDSTVITGWHGWSLDGGEGEEREGYFEFQEKGTNGRKHGIGKAEARRRQRASAGGGGGIPAANSLGQAIIPVREQLKADLKGLTK